MNPADETPAVAPQSAVQITDCWNRIGIAGDATCPDLERYIHCRHCPVYEQAGRSLLSRPLPATYRKEWTDYVASKRKNSAPSKISVVIFRIGLEWLALTTAAFLEVAEHRPVHSIPHRRHHALLGIVNIRGELLVCVSIARLLGLERAAPAPRPQSVYERLLVVAWDEKRTVFPADEVAGIHRVSPDEIAPAPTTVSRAAIRFTQGMFPWQGKVAGLLDPEAVFNNLNRNFA